MSELIVLAEIAGRRCAFESREVQSVIEIGSITPIPRAPSFILGLSALRSQALTVIDCRLAIGQPSEGFAKDARAAVVKIDGHSYALLVDSIEDIAQARTEPGPIPGGFGKEWSRVAHGMVETDQGPVLLLDIEAIVSGLETSRAAA